MENNLEKILNEEQFLAVTHKSGPLLIVAGAGTGKTTVITERIKWLLSENLARPEEILALTFTEKAAQEMQTRVDEALPYGTFGMWIGTFHSFADRVLRDEALQIGLSPNYKLMTQAETFLFIKKNFWKFDLKFYRPSGNPFKFIEGMSGHFDRLRDEDVTPDAYLEIAHNLLDTAKKSGQKEDVEEAEKIMELAKAFETYEQLKADHKKMDFSDLITNVLKLFRSRPAVLRKYRQQFKFILVDEFQDTNFSQYQLVKFLTPPEKDINLTVVGDDSQSIYAFRGAAISNILSFMKDYPTAKQVVLTKNYRSSKTILESAYKLIKHNDPDTLEFRLKISKNLVAARETAENEIELFQTDIVEEEAEMVVEKIEEMKKDPSKKWKDFAILFRANGHSEPFIKSLERRGIPFQFLGPGMLFSQPEIKDLIAYLKVLYDFTDSLSVYRVLSMDVWNISGRDLIFLLSLSKKDNLSLFQILEKVVMEEETNERELQLKTLETLKVFVEMVHEHQEKMKSETAGQILFSFLEKSGLLKKMSDFSTEEEEQKAKNIAKFFDKLKNFESSHDDASIFATVDYIDLAMNVGESPLATQNDWTENDAVNLLTVHSAKGLEFPVVFLVNLVEGRFPSRERKETLPIPDATVHEILPEGDSHLQEERRLFYVGLTRAKEKLILTAANFYGEGKRKTKLSPFIAEALGESWETSKKLTNAGSKSTSLGWAKKSSPSQPQKSDYKVEFLSYSAIDTFDICPLHYKLKNILHIPTPMTSAQSMGNAVHLTLHDFCKKINEGEIKVGQKDEQKILFDLLSKNWIKEGHETLEHEKESLQKAQDFLINYLKSSLHLQARPIFLEKSFNFWIRSSEEKVEPLKIIGKMDRVDDLGNGKIEIVDYKTGDSVPDQKKVDKDEQMSIYALAAVEQGILNKKIEDVKLTFYYFKENAIITTSRSADQLIEERARLLTIRDEIEHSDFACSGGRSCRDCEFRMLCNG